MSGQTPTSEAQTTTDPKPYDPECPHPEVHDVENDPCQWCAGSSFDEVIAEDEKTPCSACDGSGIEQYAVARGTCGKCGGLGYDDPNPAPPTEPTPERFIRIDGPIGLADHVRAILIQLDGTGPDIQPGPGDIVISPSQLSTWSTCRLRWWLEKIAKVDKPQKLAPSWGTAMHRILEDYNKGTDWRDLFPSDDWSRDADLSTAEMIVRDVLEKVPDIDVEKEVMDVTTKTHDYLEAVNWVRRDNPEEDVTAYLFTVPTCMTGPGCSDGCGKRVFLRGITDFSTQRMRPPIIYNEDDVVIRNGEPAEPMTETILGDYKSSARKWAAGRTDREPAPSFYALRERARTGVDKVSLVHEVILKKPTKCKLTHARGRGLPTDVDIDIHPEPSELCYEGRVIGQRFVTDRDLGDMGTALLQIAQFAKSRIEVGDDIDRHPPSPGWDDGNCRMCDVRAACWLKGENAGWGLTLVDNGGQE